MTTPCNHLGEFPKCNVKQKNPDTKNKDRMIDLNNILNR